MHRLVAFERSLSFGRNNYLDRTAHGATGRSR